MFDAFFDSIAAVLAWFYSIYHNYAFAIAALTTVIYILLTPLTLKANRSMMAMQEFQPEMKRIQQKYKDDRPKQQEELMAFYQEKGINPLGGCIPLIVQMPVFLILFRVLSGLTNRGDDGTFDSRYLSQDTELYQDLDVSTEMLSFGTDLSRSANDVIQSDPGKMFPFLALVGLTAAIGWYQQRQMMARNRANNTSIEGPQATLMKIMPFFLPVISFFSPAGLVVYFIVSGLLRIVQQAYIRHERDKKEKDNAANSGSKRTSGNGSGDDGSPSGSNGTAGGSADSNGSRNGSGNDRPHPKSRQSGKKKKKKR